MKKTELQEIYADCDHDVSNDERYYLVRMTELCGEDYLTCFDEDEESGEEKQEDKEGKNDEKPRIIYEYFVDNW